MDSEQILHGRLLSPRLPCQANISAIYAKCSRSERYPLWDSLRERANLLDGLPWMIGGDFNTILLSRERSGSNTNRQAEMIDFAETIEDCRLLDPGYDGADFTWAKNGLFERLDRVLITEAWSRAFENIRVTNLPRISSDHGPIIVRNRLRSTGNRCRAFRFQNMWVRHKDFMELIRNNWSNPADASGLLGLQIKLSRIRKILKLWNREEFDNIHLNL